jgi:shikimate dehydrogenase
LTERPDQTGSFGLMGPTGSTRVAGVIGDPVRHSLSPTIHNAAFAALGMDWTYLAFPVPAGRAADAVAAMKVLGIEGLSVTMPHKADVARALDRCTDAAAALDAVNCVVRDGDELIGHNTDGDGFVDALQIDEGVDVEGLRVVVVGAGGAARAVVRALAGAGAAEVVVINRSGDRAAVAAALAGPVGRVGRPDDVGTAGLVVNATPLGMGDDVRLPVPAERLGTGQIVVDLVYEPLRTPLLQAADAAGARAVGGLGMLVHQAARAFRLWTGTEPPIAAMHASVLVHLGRRSVPEVSAQPEQG